MRFYSENCEFFLRPIDLSLAIILAVMPPLIACKKQPDPTRCKIVDIGDSMDLVKDGQLELKSDQMVFSQGMADPRALRWLNKSSGEVYSITRLMGTQQRLFFLQRLKSDQTASIKTEFRGHLLRWDELPKSQSVPIAKALASQYNIQIDPQQTYLINADSKPEGCP